MRTLQPVDREKDLHRVFFPQWGVMLEVGCHDMVGAAPFQPLLGRLIERTGYNLDSLVQFPCRNGQVEIVRVRGEKRQYRPGAFDPCFAEYGFFGGITQEIIPL